MNIDINKEIIKKYDVRGPRYTSYPTVPNFKEDFTAENYKNALEGSRLSHQKDTFSLYLHIPFCKSKCFYCGCNSEVSCSEDDYDKYLSFLEKEFSLTESFLKNRNAVQIHFGGGTPNILSIEQMKRLNNSLGRSFSIEKDAETAIECDPRLLDKEYIEFLAETGFNRISIGVQDLNPEVQKSIGRVNSIEKIAEIRNYCSAAGFKSVNFDIVYGLPKQNPENFKNTLDKVIELKPERIAVYNFAYLPALLKNQEKIKETDLPGTDEKIEMLLLSINTLTEAGYEYIGMDHFALPSDELALAREKGTLRRNFQGYTVKAGSEVFAFGITGISQLEKVYSQNVKSTEEYYKSLENDKFPVFKGISLSLDDRIRREVISGIMCNDIINKNKIADIYGIDFNEYFSGEIKLLGDFRVDGMLINNPDYIKITERGKIILRNIAMTFDSYIKEDIKKNLYSRTV